MLPASLTGAVSSTALQSIADYHLQGQDERVGEMQALLHTLYNRDDSLLTAVARQTFASIEVTPLKKGQFHRKGAENAKFSLWESLNLCALRAFAVSFFSRLLKY